MLENIYTSDGKYKAPLSRNYRLQFIKELLNNWETVWKTYGKETDEQPELDESKKYILNLNQNQPNPFNPVTNISYSLPSVTRVTIAIYDILGRKVAVLVDNEMITAGEHKVLWNGKDRSGNTAASGIYICRLAAGSNILTKKITLVR